MKCLYPTILLFLLNGTVLAQDLFSAFPTCAVACLAQAIPKTSCALADVSCLCQSQPLWDSVTVCAIQGCTTREALTAQKLASQACNFPRRNESSTLPIVSCVMTSVSALFIVLRIIARSPRRFELMGWDDGFIILCFLTAIPLTVSHFFLAKNGIGQDIWEVSFDQIDGMLFWFYFAEPFYLASTVLMKISILLFYLRVFIDQNFRRVVYGVMALCVAYAIAFFFPLIFQCSPIAYAWTKWDAQAQGKCINLNLGVWIHAAVNILFDLIVLALPLQQFAKLNFSYSWRSKAQIGIMFGIGLLVTVVSCLRLAELVRFSNTINPTWDYLGAALWSGIEVWVGIICACLPTARVFVGRMLPKWLGMSYAKSTIEKGQPARLQRKMPPKQVMSWDSRATPLRLDEEARLVDLRSWETSDDFRKGRAV